MAFIKQGSTPALPKTELEEIKGGKLNKSLKTKLISIRKSVRLKRPYYAMEWEEYV